MLSNSKTQVSYGKISKLRLGKSVMGQGVARPQATKIVIRPHVAGMTYDGPIKVSDDEWVAMQVNVDEEI
ncbi:hypothetical protein Tco_0596580 [Tanacetum coccineum]